MTIRLDTGRVARRRTAGARRPGCAGAKPTAVPMAPARPHSRRRAVRRLLLLPALLVAAAVAIGGLGAFLLGFAALLLLVDRALGSSGVHRLEAESSFARAQRERRVARLLRRDAGDLAYLAEDRGWVATSYRRRLGRQAIPVDSIVGTVDAKKATAFDRAFRPPPWTRGRWTQMYLAAQAGTPMPPISVYRAGDEHYLRDGHHRVSVARALGASEIDAEVVELRRPAGA